MCKTQKRSVHIPLNKKKKKRRVILRHWNRLCACYLTGALRAPYLPGAAYPYRICQISCSHLKRFHYERSLHLFIKPELKDRGEGYLNKTSKILRFLASQVKHFGAELFPILPTPTESVLLSSQITSFCSTS